MLDNKVIIVTGGAGLLGAEFVKAIVKHNGIAIIGDVREDAAARLIQSMNINDSKNAVDFFPLNIVDKQSITDFIETVNHKYGKIDALVNNAYPRNQQYGRAWQDVEYSSFCENINLNLGGYFLTSQQITQYFLQQGFGNIINIASIYGVIAPKFEIYENTKMTMPVEYAIIKSGLIHLTKYFAKSLTGKDIRVNALSPGGIFDAQPQEFISAYKNHCINKGMLDKKDLVGALLFLLSDMSKYINGQNLIVDDGFTL